MKITIKPEDTDLIQRYELWSSRGTASTPFEFWNHVLLDMKNLTRQEYENKAKEMKKRGYIRAMSTENAVIKYDGLDLNTITL